MNINKEELAKLLEEAADAYNKYEKEQGETDENWALWYAEFIINKIKL